MAIEMWNSCNCSQSLTLVCEMNSKGTSHTLVYSYGHHFRPVCYLHHIEAPFSKSILSQKNWSYSTPWIKFSKVKHNFAVLSGNYWKQTLSLQFSFNVLGFARVKRASFIQWDYRKSGTHESVCEVPILAQEQQEWKTSCGVEYVNMVWSDILES